MRASFSNGIWLCQTHAKEIDDDEVRFPADILRAWKHAAENDARAMIGVPVSSQAIDICAEVVIHRADDDGLIVIAATNLPNGTKVWVQLGTPEDRRTDKTKKAVVHEGTIAVSGFRNDSAPYSHGWYRIELLSYFNGPWGQPAPVTEIVGEEGKHLAGRFAEPLHPELPESEKIFRAEFQCVAPMSNSSPPRSPADIQQAIAIAQDSTLIVDGRISAGPLREVVEWFMGSPGLRPHEGWLANALPNGAFLVIYSFWNGSAPTCAEWIVILERKEVRYRNLYGKLMSWLSPD